jgi:hypothetical protein
VAHGEKFPEDVGVVSAHSYWRSRPSAEKTKVALWLSVLASGPDSMVTGGARPPMFQLWSAGVGSRLPSASLARTAKSCSP